MLVSIKSKQCNEQYLKLSLRLCIKSHLLIMIQYVLILHVSGKSDKIRLTHRVDAESCIIKHRPAQAQEISAWKGRFSRFCLRSQIVSKFLNSRVVAGGFVMRCAKKSWF